MIALLLCILPTDSVLTDRCVELELQHFYDDCGRHVFDQYIFWELRQGHRVVKDWRLAKGQLPQRTATGWKLRFSDQGRIREVTASHFQESWGQDDREILNRELWPVEARTKLSEVPP